MSTSSINNSSIEQNLRYNNTATAASVAVLANDAIQAKQPPLKVINTVNSAVTAADDLAIYTPTRIFAASEVRTIDEAQLTQITSSPILDTSASCAAISMLKIFVALAESMQANSKWQEQMIDTMNDLNSAVMSLSQSLGKIVNEIENLKAITLEHAVKEAATWGLTFAVLQVVAGVAMLSMGMPMGLFIVANGITQAVGNIAAYHNPTEAEKENSWQDQLAKDGIFMPLDKINPNAGQNAQMLVSLVGIIATGGSSGLSMVESMSELSASQITCRVISLLNDAVRLFGYGASILSDSSADQAQAGLLSSLSGGAMSAAIYALLQSTDQASTTQVITFVLTSIGNMAFSSGLQMGSANSEVDLRHGPELMALITKVMNNLNMFNGLLAASVGIQRAKFTAISAGQHEFLALIRNMEAQFEASEGQANQLLSEITDANKKIMDHQEELVSTVKTIEQIFSNAFARYNSLHVNS